MAGTEITFSEYATAFYQIIDGSKTSKAEFVKDLLKIGLNSEGNGWINDLFPTIINGKGETCFENNKGDQLRKYLIGKNGISKIAYELEYYFDEELYIEELQEYDCDILTEFAQRLNIDIDYDYTDEDYIYMLSVAIARLYASILKNASTKKSIKSFKTKDEPKPDENKVVFSYTITDTEKKNLVRLCELIKESLSSLKYLIDRISKKRHELKTLADPECDKRWKKYLECEVTSLEQRFKGNYSELEKLCADVSDFLEPKKGIHNSFDAIVLIARNISSDVYNATCPDKFDYNSFSVMISRFNDSYNRLLCDIDKL